MNPVTEIGVIAAVTGMAVVATAAVAVREFIRRHGMGLIVARWFIGHPLNGVYHTDAGFLAYGTKVISNRSRVTRWHHRPYAHRAAIRWAWLLGFIGTGYGFTQSVNGTEYGLASAGFAALLVASLASARKIRAGSHERGTVQPLSVAIAPLVGLSPAAARDSIRIEPGFRSAGSSERVGLVVLPDDYRATPDDRRSVEHLISSRLGISCDYAWRLDRKPFTLEIRKSPELPALVPMAKMLPAIRELPSGKVLLGVTGTGECKTWDMSGEDPHMLVSANTRRGKTRLLLLIASQVLAQGADHVHVIDPKRVGVDSVLNGIPGARVFNDPRDIGSMQGAITGFRQMMDDRIDAYVEDRTLEFPRALLVIDELSQFASMVKAHWDATRDKGTKATPPVWSDLAAVLWQGGQFGCNVLVFGQRIEHSTLGGLLDSFGTRLLAGYTKRTFDRLIGTTPALPASKQRGRFVYYNGDQPVQMQTVLGTDQELRDLAMSGARAAVHTTIQTEVTA